MLPSEEAGRLFSARPPEKPAPYDSNPALAGLTPGPWDPLALHPSFFQRAKVLAPIQLKKSCIPLEKAVFLMGPEDRGFPVWQISLLPGQRQSGSEPPTKWELILPK